MEWGEPEIGTGRELDGDIFEIGLEAGLDDGG